jgi:hypothetical protein
MKLATCTVIFSESKYRVDLALIGEDLVTGEVRQLRAILENNYDTIALWESCEAQHLSRSVEWPSNWEHI